MTQKEQARIRRQEIADVKAILDTAEGIRFFRRIFVNGRVLSTTYAGENTQLSAFQEGARNAALTYFNDALQADPVKALEILRDSRKTPEEEKASGDSNET